MTTKAQVAARLNELIRQTEVIMPETNRIEICPTCGARTVVELSENEHGDQLQRSACRKGHWYERYGPRLDTAGGIGTMVVPAEAVAICRNYAALHKD